ncbi:histidine kinase [Nocardia beijingensis]|uniref:sensor histidine kinase n=1 Tax=Nocardia beijingensis TaxID=95162 RepID=UPI0033FB3D6D
MIEHDAALDGQAEATDAAITAVALAIDNARLYATQQAQLEQLRLSRLRLAQTAFDERRRIQRDLHDGSQQRFFRILMLLDSAHRALASGEEPEPEKAQRAVSAAYAELTDTIRALRDLTQGIYPAVLNAHGLGAAIEDLADRGAEAGHLPADPATMAETR